MIFYSDVDDTLMQEGIPSDELKNFLETFNKKKGIFVPCSGRPTSNMKNIFRKFPKIDYIIGFNGGEIVDLKKDKVIFKNGITKELMNKIVDELKKLNLDYVYYDDEKIFTNNKSNEYAKVERDLTFLELIQTTDINDSIKIIGLSDPKKTDENIKYLKNRLPELEISKSKPFFIEITNKNITKGNAILKLNEIVNKKLDQTYVFGDSYNDLSMFELPVNKIAVKNAATKILDLADDVCLSCQNDGVVKYVKKILENVEEIDESKA